MMLSLFQRSRQYYHSMFLFLLNQLWRQPELPPYLNADQRTIRTGEFELKK